MYLERRRRVWWALHDLPADVRDHFGGKARLRESLGTEDKDVAKIRAAVLEASWLSEIKLARSSGITGLERRAMYWRKAMKGADEAQRELIQDAIEAEADAMWQPAADRAGINSTNDHRLEDLPERQQANRFIAMATGALIRLDEHLIDFLATQTGIEAKSRDMRERTIRQFAEKFPYLEDVTRKAVQLWVNGRAQDGKKADTIRRYISEVRQYWSYLASVEVVPDDLRPFEKLTYPKDGKAALADERQPFTSAQVSKLLEAAIAEDDASLADLIRLGMWTGARIEELCALPVSMVRDQYISIADAKTAAGWRDVPIHPKLAPHLLQMVERSTDGYVLSGLTTNKYGDRSNALGKRFGRMKKSLGHGPALVFHSIRKTVATLLENAGVPEGVAADIIGHDKPTMTYGLYSGGASLAVKQEAIGKIDYP